MKQLSAKLFMTVATAYSAIFSSQSVLAASPYSFSYGGRLADDNDVAVKGPIDIELRFYRTASGGTHISVSPVTFSSITLVDGVFQVDISSLTAEEMHAVFAQGQQTWIEVTAGGVSYPRQMIVSVPYALKVPTDSTLSWNSLGELSVGPTTAPGAGQFLTKDGDGNWAWGSPVIPATASSLTGTPVSATAPASGEILKFSGGAWTPTTDSSINRNGDTGVGSLIFGAQAKLGLGTYTTAQEAAIGAGDVGKVWFNSDTNQIRYRDGSGIQAVGAAGAGITSFNGLTAGAQTLATGTGGTAPAFNSSSSVHTLDIPNANAVGVTGGLISKSEYDTFNAKQAAITSATTLSVDSITTNGSVGLSIGGSGSVAQPLRLNNGNNTNGLSLKAHDSSSSYTLTFPSGNGSNGQTLVNNGSGGLSWGAPTIPAGTVSSAELGSNSVSNSHIVDGQVTTPDLAAAAVTTAKIAADAVTSSEIANDAVGASEILADAVSQSELAPNAVGSAEIIDNEIVNADIAAAAAISPTKIANVNTSIIDANGNNIGAPIAIGTTDSQPLKFLTGNAERMQIDTAGLVGIGTSVPGFNLHVYNASGATIYSESSNNNVFPSLVGAINGTTWIATEAHGSGDTNSLGGVTLGGKAAITTGGQDIVIAPANPGKIYLGSGSTNALTVASTGNVGIGTTTPAEMLHVAGGLRVDGPIVTGAGQPMKVRYGGGSYTLGSTITAGGSQTTAISFGYTFSAPPTVVVTRTNSSGGNVAVLGAISATTTGFTLEISNPTSTGIPGSTVVDYNWIVIGN